MTMTAAATAATRLGRVNVRPQPFRRIAIAKVPDGRPRRWKSSSHNSPAPPMFNPSNPTHLIFGANTDVGKTIVSAGLVRVSMRGLELGSSEQDDRTRMGYVHYLKPLQCGGSDEKFVERHVAGAESDSDNDSDDDPEGADSFVPGLMCNTLFEWDTPASPHVSSRLEDAPASDSEVLTEVRETLNMTGDAAATFVETAGGVMSPSSASPLNGEAWHSRWGAGVDDVENDTDSAATDSSQSSPNRHRSWGWSAQADLYSPLYSRLNLPAVLVGDGRLGGISVTLSSLEALESRGYAVRGVILIDDGHCGHDNARALEEYVASARGRRERGLGLGLGGGGVDLDDERDDVPEGGGLVGVHLLPAVPPMPEPLHGWFAKQEVEETFQELNAVLCDQWRQSR